MTMPIQAHLIAHPDTVAGILAHQFVGCFAFDHAAFNQIEAFVARSDVSLADKHAALNHMGVAGMGFPPATLAETEAYLAELGV